MIGAIAGDMIGSSYEASPIKHKNFEILVSAFTDDTVLTVAVADAILGDGDFAETIIAFLESTSYVDAVKNAINKLRPASQQIFFRYNLLWLLGNSLSFHEIRLSDPKHLIPKTALRRHNGRHKYAPCRPL